MGFVSAGQVGHVRSGPSGNDKRIRAFGSDQLRGDFSPGHDLDTRLQAFAVQVIDQATKLET